MNSQRDFMWRIGQLIHQMVPNPDHPEELESKYYIADSTDMLECFENKDFKITFDSRYAVWDNNSIGRQAEFYHKKIFEGDYIEYGDRQIGLVVYEDGEFFIRPLTNDEGRLPLYSTIKDDGSVRVLGNNYDDKDFMESDERFMRWYIIIPDNIEDDNGDGVYIKNLEVDTYSEYSKKYIRGNYITEEEAKKDAALFKGAKVESNTLRK